MRRRAADGGEKKFRGARRCRDRFEDGRDEGSHGRLASVGFGQQLDAVREQVTGRASLGFFGAGGVGVRGGEEDRAEEQQRHEGGGGAQNDGGFPHGRRDLLEKAGAVNDGKQLDKRRDDSS